MVETVNHLTSHLCSCTLSTPIFECGERSNEFNEYVNLKLHGEEGELKQEGQQEEKIEISAQKEVVDGCLGYVEHIKESRIEELSSKKLGGDVAEKSNVVEVNKKLEKIGQEVGSIASDFLPMLINPLDDLVEPFPSGLGSKVEEDLNPPRPTEDEELGEVFQATNAPIYDDSESTCDPFEFEESFPNLSRFNDEVDFTLPPIYDESNGEEIEEIGEKGCKLEEAWHDEEFEEPRQVVETFRRRWTGVEHALSRSLGTPPPNSSSNPPLEWVKLLTLSFIIPLEYGLLETDGQLRALCGIKRKRRIFSGWRSKSRLIMVGSSKLKSMDWCNAQVNGSRRVVWCCHENSAFSSLGQSQGNQLEDGCEDKIWDPGLSYDSQFWELTS